MIADLGLPSLLAALREAGLGVGVAEVARLQAVFARQPDLPKGEGAARDRLGSLLVAVMVKSGEDREVFERVFEAWFERADGSVRQRSNSTQPERYFEGFGEPVEPLVAGKQRKSKPWWSAAAALLVFVGGLSVRWDTRWAPSPLKVRSPLSQTAAVSKPPTAAEIRKRSFMSWVPSLVVTTGTPVWTGWPALGIGLFAMLVGGGIWGVFRGRRWVPERKPEPVFPGPPRVFISPPSLRGAQLVTPRQQESLIWGIGRYLTEEPTRRLDLVATVRATARAGGIPNLHFEQARYQREVWLWTDETVDDPALLRLADEIEELLQAHGLPVERAAFRGLPERLVAAGGQAFAPNEIDERREVALVAVLTDGRILGQRWAAVDCRAQVDALLRGLSSWPNLAFVDFSDSGNSLPRILARHSLPLIAPAELASFLGGAISLSTGSETSAGEIAGHYGDSAWAAVCAVGPAPVAEETAFELRAHLGLVTSPWALRALRREAPGPPGRLRWNRPDRARLLNWLRGAEAHLLDRLAPKSLLARALDLWEQIYERELENRTKGAGATPWIGTPAQEHLVLERTLLRLWRNPRAAVRDLYQLHRGLLGETIRQHLTGFAPAGQGREGQIELPWRWQALSPVSQVMLQEMGFAGGTLPRVSLGRPGRLRLGVGLCLGLGLGALCVATASGPGRPEGRPIVTHGAGKPIDAREWVEAGSGGRWRVMVFTHKWSVSHWVEPGSRISVRWNREKHSCVEALDEGSVWHCGSFVEPQTKFPEPSSILLLDVNSLSQEVDDLVLALLDRASTNTAVVRRMDGKDLYVWMKYTKPGSFSRLIARNIDASSILSHLPGRLEVAGCRPIEEMDASGLTFVRICPSAGVSREFWMGKYEVTNKEYRTVQSKQRKGDDEIPASNVSWKEATQFCEHYGYRLPSMSEWLYANDGYPVEESLEQYGWFAGNSGGKLHPVGTLWPNPRGLYDLSGNVREWVTNPGMDNKVHMMLGGGFLESPQGSHKQVFSAGQPDRFTGFRCARDPRHPPS